ncbi:unnamed protein product, partial [Ectocarpus sp. 12 AP-2014]
MSTASPSSSSRSVSTQADGESTTLEEVSRPESESRHIDTMYSPGSDRGGFREEEPSSRVFEGSETPKGTTFPSIGADPENASTLAGGGRSSGVGGWSSFKDNSSAIAGSKGRDEGGGDDW